MTMLLATKLLLMSKLDNTTDTFMGLHVPNVGFIQLNPYQWIGFTYHVFQLNKVEPEQTIAFWFVLFAMQNWNRMARKRSPIPNSPFGVSDNIGFKKLISKIRKLLL
jgi:hypothetical protein